MLWGMAKKLKKFLEVKILAFIILGLEKENWYIHWILKLTRKISFYKCYYSKLVFIYKNVSKTMNGFVWFTKSPMDTVKLY